MYTVHVQIIVSVQYAYAYNVCVHQIWWLPGSSSPPTRLFDRVVTVPCLKWFETRVWFQSYALRLSVFVTFDRNCPSLSSWNWSSRCCLSDGRFFIDGNLVVHWFDHLWSSRARGRFHWCRTSKKILAVPSRPRPPTCWCGRCQLSGVKTTQWWFYHVFKTPIVQIPCSTLLQSNYGNLIEPTSIR